MCNTDYSEFVPLMVPVGVSVVFEHGETVDTESKQPPRRSKVRSRPPSLRTRLMDELGLPSTFATHAHAFYLKAHYWATGEAIGREQCMEDGFRWLSRRDTSWHDAVALPVKHQSRWRKPFPVQLQVGTLALLADIAHYGEGIEQVEKWLFSILDKDFQTIRWLQKQQADTPNAPKGLLWSEVLVDEYQAVLNNSSRQNNRADIARALPGWDMWHKEHWT